MQGEILGQLRGVKDALYGHSLSLSLEEYWLWLYFAVLVATGNLTKITIAGDFYLLEGFPFLNMYPGKAPIG
jgi:hypothetical protein